MTPQQIEAEAEKLRNTPLTMSNYHEVFNNALVLIRELAKALASGGKNG